MHFGRQFIIGALWNNGAKNYETTVRFLGSIYLARTIDPEFFGQVGLAASIAALLFVTVMFGQDFAIFRQDKDIHRFVSTQLTMRISMVAILGVVVMILATTESLPVAPSIRWFVVVLFLAEAPMQITAIYVHDMQRQLRFRPVAMIGILSTSGAVGLACGLAYAGHTIWALLWLLMAKQIISAALTLILSHQLLRPSFDKEMAKDSFHYGKYVFASNVSQRVYSQIDDISIGAFVGNAALGFYQRAYGLGSLLQQFITGGITAISGPLFGKLQSDPDRLGHSFELILGVLLRVAVGGYLWMALVLTDLIVLLYGEKWLPSVPLFRLLLPFALVQGVNQFIRSIHLVAGRPSVEARIQIIKLVTLLVLLFPSLYWIGLKGAAIAVDVSAVLGMGLLLYYLRPFFKFNIRRLFLSPALAAIVTFLVFLFALDSGNTASERFLRLMLNTVAIAGIYVASLLVLEFNSLRETYGRLRRALAESA